MKKFDLQAALTGAKVVTRDGREVMVLGYFDKLQGQKLLTVINNDFITFNDNGTYYESEIKDDFDLFLLDPEPNITMVTKDTTLGDFFKLLDLNK